MRGSGALEVWKPTTIAVKSNDWVSVAIVSATKNSALTLRKTSTYFGGNIDHTNYREPEVNIKAKGGGCMATKTTTGVFRVAEDCTLSYACRGDSDVTATVSISKDDPERVGWIPD